jgi:hypothetical protein
MKCNFICLIKNSVTRYFFAYRGLFFVKLTINITKTNANGIFEKLQPYEFTEYNIFVSFYKVCGNSLNRSINRRFTV